MSDSHLRPREKELIIKEKHRDSEHSEIFKQKAKNRTIKWKVFRNKASLHGEENNELLKTEEQQR